MNKSSERGFILTFYFFSSKEKNNSDKQDDKQPNHFQKITRKKSRQKHSLVPSQ